jgi:hypothetical protein
MLLFKGMISAEEFVLSCPMIDKELNSRNLSRAYIEGWPSCYCRVNRYIRTVRRKVLDFVVKSLP